MTRETESKIRAVFQKKIDAAIERIVEDEMIDSIWWPAGVAERLAEQVTQSVALMQEVTDEK